MGFLVGAFDEILRLEALAHQTALHVHLTRQNRVDAPFGDVLFQIFKCVSGGHDCGPPM